ncbi:MAG TPA: 23S rRNA pseudouridine(2604) synthase RluF [Bacteroidia bacterium]|nr:23S rRNA pseudouridine(2604) synthase RluF [Bacteroidia bacterium]
MNTQNAIRLNKFISESGICSRREADRWIEAGRVTINKRKAVIGDLVKAGDKVIANGQELEPRKGEELVLIALNKPTGITSTTELNVRDNIIQFVNFNQRIFPIGRLDKDSQGLIFLTNNGDLVNKILRAGNHHEKEYIVTVDKILNEQVINNMAAGVPMLGVTTKKCKIEQINAHTFKIILVQGLNRQIRRMCEHFGYEVTILERIRIMNISLKGLPIGEWRELTEQEKIGINALIANSSSEKIKHSSNPDLSVRKNKEYKEKFKNKNQERNTKKNSSNKNKEEIKNKHQSSKKHHYKSNHARGKNR